MTDRRKVQMRFCRFCKQYTPGCVHTTPGPEPVMGWIALALFLGMGVVAWLGTCA